MQFAIALACLRVWQAKSQHTDAWARYSFLTCWNTSNFGLFQSLKLGNSVQLQHLKENLIPPAPVLESISENFTLVSFIQPIWMLFDFKCHNLDTESKISLVHRRFALIACSKDLSCMSISWQRSAKSTSPSKQNRLPNFKLTLENFCPLLTRYSCG